MSKKTYEQFLWPLWAFVLLRGKMCFACMDGTLIVTIRKFSEIWKGDRMNPNFDQSPILFLNAKTIKKKVLSDSRKKYAVTISASPLFCTLILLCSGKSIPLDLNFLQCSTMKLKSHVKWFKENCACDNSGIPEFVYETHFCYTHLFLF